MEVPGDLSTLAGTRIGESVVVSSFLSEPVRRRFSELGLAEGGRMCCRDQTATMVVVGLPEGHSVAVDRPSARLIQVERV